MRKESSHILEGVIFKMISFTIGIAIRYMESHAPSDRFTRVFSCMSQAQNEIWRL